MKYINSFVKTVLILFLVFSTSNFIQSCANSKIGKTPDTVEEAELLLAKKRKKESKAKRKENKAIQKRYWDMQTKEAKKSIKRNKKRMKKNMKKGQFIP